MRALPVALLAGSLLLAGLALVPTASASCMEVHHAAVLVTCFVCPTANAAELACGIERDANAFASCFLDTAPAAWVATCV